MKVEHTTLVLGLGNGASIKKHSVGGFEMGGLLNVLCLLVLVTTGSGCLRPKPVTTVIEKPVIREIRVPCLVAPPPKGLPVPEPVECKPGFLCLSVADMNTLSDNVEQLEVHSQKAWDRCGKVTP